MTHHFYRWYVYHSQSWASPVADRQGNGRRNSQRSVWTDGSMEEWRENMSYVCVYIYTSSTRTRRGGSCLKDIYIYKTFLIYRTCMRHAPAKPVRACTLRNWCLVSHITFEAPLHTSHLTVFTLHTTHFTLHSSHCTLRTSHSTLFTLHTALFALHTSHFTLRT